MLAPQDKTSLDVFCPKTQIKQLDRFVAFRFLVVETESASLVKYVLLVLNSRAKIPNQTLALFSVCWYTFTIPLRSISLQKKIMRLESPFFLIVK